MSYPIKLHHNHIESTTYARDDLRDIKVNRTTRTRLAAMKSEYGFKNLDELINPALDALKKERMAKK